MNAYLYKIECLTNLHVGSGDANYSIVDNEVEKDEVLGSPVIHASGVKGALRDFAEAKGVANVIEIFGSPAASKVNARPGAVKFMDACLLTRPLRVRDNSGALTFLPVTTLAILNHFIRTTDAFGCPPAAGLKPVAESNLPFNGKNFLCTRAGIRVEDEPTEVLPKQLPQLTLLKQILGEDFVIARSLEDYRLPVSARNALDDNKTSKNLWYEEYVPHDSIFFLTVLSPLSMDWLPNGSIVQFGGNASVGYGFTRISSWPAAGK